MRLRRIVLCALALATAGAAQARQLVPMDEGPQDPSFVRFRQKLIDAARKQDRASIWSIVDPRIKWSFGTDSGMKGFKKHWTEAGPGALEAQLLRLLLLGGEFERKGEFWAPYVYSQWPEQYDAFQYQAITGKNVNVRQRPSQDAPVIARLTYDIVKRAPDPPATHAQKSPAARGEWVRIVTPAGKQGFVAAQHIRSPIDFRASFQKRGGRWWMTLLVAGD